MRLPFPKLDGPLIRMIEESHVWQNLVDYDGLPPYLGQRIVHTSMLVRRDGANLFYHEAVLEYVRCEDCAGLVLVRLDDDGTLNDPHALCHICEAYHLIEQEDLEGPYV